MTRVFSFLACLLVAAAIFAFFEIGMVVRELRTKIATETITKIDATKVNATIDTVNVTIKSLKTAADDADKEEKELASQYDETRPNSIPNRIYRLLSHADDAVGRTDFNLNGGHGVVHPVLPELGNDLAIAADTEKAAALELQKSADALTNTQQELSPILADLATSAGSLSAETPPILANIEDASKHVDQTSAHVDDATHDIAQFVHRELAPVRGTWNMLKSFLIEFAAPGSDITTAIRK